MIAGDGRGADVAHLSVVESTAMGLPGIRWLVLRGAPPRRRGLHPPRQAERQHPPCRPLAVARVHNICCFRWIRDSGGFAGNRFIVGLRLCGAGPADCEPRTDSTPHASARARESDLHARYHCHGPAARPAAA